MAHSTEHSGAAEPFSWRVVSRRGSAMSVALRGEIDENADFSDLRPILRGDVELQLDGITRINSCGVREWVNFVRSLRQPLVRSLAFARCSATVVLQLNTIYNFRGRARVSSFFAPYVCESCHADEYKLLSVDEHFPDRTPHQLPAFRCARCGGTMLFDELPERYLSFLAEDESRGNGGDVT
jgi:hypothetical protein